MAVTGDKIVSKALKYLGSGGGKFWKDYGLPTGTAWCCAFVWDIFRMCGASKLFYGGEKTAYVPTAQQWLKKNCKHVKMADARPGDIVIFTWSGNGYNSEKGATRDHIGLIRSKGTSSIAYTVEGNTLGGKVAKRTRASRYIYAIYRPNYPKKTNSKKKTYSGAFPKLPKRGYFKTGDKGAQVKRLQKLLNWAIDAGLAVDGEIGKKTKAAIGTFQASYKLKVDYLFGSKCLAKTKSIRK